MNHPTTISEGQTPTWRNNRSNAPRTERGLVQPDRLAKTITEFIERRGFSYWLRLAVEIQESLSDPMIAILRERCPWLSGVCSPPMPRSIPRSRSFFGFAFSSGRTKDVSRPYSRGLAPCRLAILRDLCRSARMDQLRAHWKQCRRAWKLQPPETFPSFEAWARVCRFSTVDPRSFRLHKLRYPKSGVLVKHGPFQGLGVSVEERLQGSFIDPAIPLPVENTCFNPLLNA